MQLSSSSSDSAQLRRHDTSVAQSPPSSEPNHSPAAAIDEQKQAAASERDDPFFIGATISQRYRIQSLLLSDDAALIYRARDLRWDLSEICTDVAIKVLRPELRFQPQWIARIKREFYQTRLIKHPNIVRMYGLDCHEGVWFIAMELLRGVSLAAQLRRLSTPLPQQDTAAILSACHDAIEFAHERRITHGDLNPSNVFLLNSGAVRLLGFGAATSYVTPMLAKAGDGLALRSPQNPRANEENLLEKASDPRDDSLGLANLARELLAAAATPRLGVDNEVRVHPSPKNHSDLSEHAHLIEDNLRWKRDALPFSARTLSHSNPPAIAPPAPIEKAAPPMIRPRLPIENAPMGEQPKKPAVISPALPPAVESPPQAEKLQATVEFIPARESIRPAYWKAAGVVLALGAIGWTLSHRQDKEPPIVTAAADTQSRTAGISGVPQATEPGVINKAPAISAGIEPAGNSIAEPAAAPATVAKQAADSRPPAVLPKQEISFDVNALTVSARASAAVLTLKRSKGREGRLRVNWKINQGTAVAGREFSGSTTGSVEFAHWQVVRSLYIPLIAPSSGDGSGSKKFTVEITEVSNGARIAPSDSVTVSIRDFG